MKKILSVFFTIGLLFCFVGCGERGPVPPITKDFDYDIDSKWMNRVKQIVDWAYEEDMYVIMNIHHDNCTKDNFKNAIGFYPSEECKDESIKYITRVWEQVSETFKDYDEKLVFEILNEPRLQGDEHEWNYNSSCSTCKEAMNSLNEFNQNALDTIRASGGNNANRLVMVPSIAASPDAAFNSDFKLPIDSAENALALSVHMYTPYPFAMGVPGGETFTSGDKGTLDYYFNKLNDKFVSKGIPVVIGEMGATNKDNLKDREAWFDYFNNGARKYGMTACVWDNGSWDVSDGKYKEKYGYYNRIKQEWYFPTLMEKAIAASKNSSFTPQNRAQEIVYNMQFGWNLGNTLDATASSQNAGLSTETGWGQPKTTQAMIKGLKALGINTIRIPISWHNHISK